MYDDLARTQNPTAVEWFVVHVVIPSVVLTAALHWSPVARATSGWPYVECTFPLFIETVPEGSESPVPDVFPTLISMPRPTYPAFMRRSGIKGRVVLRGLVNTRGRVYPWSILVLRTSDVEFIPA